MALCLTVNLEPSEVTASLSRKGLSATQTPIIADAYFAVACPMDNLKSCFSMGGWDDEAGWDDELGWTD